MHGVPGLGQPKLCKGGTEEEEQEQEKKHLIEECT
jgi:hypothetical protein